MKRGIAGRISVIKPKRMTQQSEVQMWERIIELTNTEDLQEMINGGTTEIHNWVKRCTLIAGSVYVVLPTADYRRIMAIDDLKKRIINLLLVCVDFGREGVGEDRCSDKNGRSLNGTRIENFLYDQRKANIAYTEIHFTSSSFQTLYTAFEDIFIIKSRLFDRSLVKTYNDICSVLSISTCIDTSQKFSSGIGCSRVFEYILSMFVSGGPDIEVQHMEPQWTTPNWNDDPLHDPYKCKYFIKNSLCQFKFQSEFITLHQGKEKEEECVLIVFCSHSFIHSFIYSFVCLPACKLIVCYVCACVFMCVRLC